MLRNTTKIHKKTNCRFSVSGHSSVKVVGRGAGGRKIGRRNNSVRCPRFSMCLPHRVSGGNAAQFSNFRFGRCWGQIRGAGGGRERGEKVCARVAERDREDVSVSV